MPSITPLGLARQTTLAARQCEEALENTMVLLEPERHEYIEQARIHQRQIVAWCEFARMRGWDVAERHASTMATMTNQWLHACQE